MTKLERLGNAITWAIILLAALWLCLIAIPSFVDRISRHTDAWQRQTMDMPSVKPSEGD